MLSVVSVLASSIQAGPSCNTSWPCFSCAASAGARMPVGHHGVDSAEVALITLQICTCIPSFICMQCCQSAEWPSACTGCLYLNEGGRRCRPGFVQNALGQVFTEVFEEGVAYMIQEVLVLRTVFLVTVDEAFDEPEGKGQMQGKEIYYTCKMQLQKHTHK